MYYSHLKTIPRGAFVDLINASPRAHQPDYYPLSYPSFLHRPSHLISFSPLPSPSPSPLLLPLFLFYVYSPYLSPFVYPSSVSVTALTLICFPAHRIMLRANRCPGNPGNRMKIKTLSLCRAVHLHNSYKKKERKKEKEKRKEKREKRREKKPARLWS